MLHDNWIRFGAYMWPAASEKRLKFLTETLVYIFLFDGKRNHLKDITTLITCDVDAWEENDESTVSRSKLLRLPIYNSPMADPNDSERIRITPKGSKALRRR